MVVGVDGARLRQTADRTSADVNTIPPGTIVVVDKVRLNWLGLLHPTHVELNNNIYNN